MRVILGLFFLLVILLLNHIVINDASTRGQAYAFSFPTIRVPPLRFPIVLKKKKKPKTTPTPTPTTTPTNTPMPTPTPPTPIPTPTSTPMPTPTPTPMPTPTPTPTPTPEPLPQGKQIYRISHSSKVVGPKMYEVTVDPFDPPIGAVQIITAKIRYTSPVVSASVRLDADTTQQSYPLTLVTGTDLDGTWQASWTTTDRHDRRYYASFTIASTIDSYTGGLTFRP